MLKNYRNELAAIAVAFGLISYTVYVCAAEPVKAKPVVVEAKKEVAKPTDKKAAKPVKPAKEVKPAAELAKKEHEKKPTLKAKFADKK